MKTLYNWRAWLGATAVLITAALLSLWAAREVAENVAWQRHTLEVLAKSQDVLAHLRDAETGQRGYLLTGDPRYLRPYSRGAGAVGEAFRDLRRLTADNEAQQRRLEAMQPLIAEKLAELQKTIELRRQDDAAAALGIVQSGEGRALMDSIRRLMAEVQAEESRLLNRRNAAFESSLLTLLVVIFGTTVFTVVIVGGSAYRIRQVGNQMRRTAAFQQALVDSADAAIISTNPEGIVTSFSRGAERLLGYPAAEVVGTETPALWHDADEIEARAGELTRELGVHIEPGFEVFAALPRQRRTDTREWTYVRKDGTRVPVLLSVTAMQDAHGKSVGFLGVARDITKRKEAEQALALQRDRLDLALTSSNLAMWESDIRAGRISLDERWGLMIGEEPRASVTTADALLGLVHPDDRERVLAALADVTAGHTAEYRVEHRVRSKSGEWRWLESRGKVVERDDRGRALRMIGTNADISDRKRAEQALVAARNDAQRANVAKDLFLATMSHEMRTPLNGLLGMLELVALMGLNDEQREAITIARDSGRSLMRIIDDVLDHAKIEAGKLAIHPEPVSIAAIVQRVVNTYHALASAKDLVLKHSVDPAISPALLADPLRVLQILGNFVSNAIKFTPDGYVEVRAELVNREDGAETVRLAVKDTGIGISAEAQERLFQPFEQAGPTTSRLYGGTGLGLAISRRLSEMMDGVVQMESAPGKGTTMSVTLTLPISESQVTEQVSEAKGPVHERTGQPVAPIAFAESRSVLIADDNSTNRLLLKRQLAMLGLHADTASDGTEALAAWQAGRYDLVITDCNMPEMDGYALSRSIRNIEATEGRPRTPIIGWTANVLPQVATQCEGAGMDDMLPKPAELAVLRTSLEQWLRGSAGTWLLRGHNIAGVSQDSSSGNEPLDRQMLNEITGGDDELALELLQEFSQCQRAPIADLEKALEGQDFATIARASHRLKSAASSIGAAALAAICDRIETAAGENDRASLANLRPSFASTAARTMDALSKIV